MRQCTYLGILLTLVSFICFSCGNVEENPPEPDVVTPTEPEPTDCTVDPVVESNGLIISLAEGNHELPQNVSIQLKVEEIINNDTVGVADLMKDDFVISENNRLINPLESEVKITPIPGEFNNYTLLLLDLSGSILNSESLNTLKNASKEFLKGIIRNSNGNPQAAVYWFDGDTLIHELIAFTGDTAALDDAINGINASISQDRSTNLHGAIEQGTNIVKALEGVDNDGVVNVSQLVVFTDGDDEAAWRTEQDAADAINSTIGREVSIYTMGLGDIISREKLELFGRDGFEFVDNYDALLRSFENISERISANVNSFYFFEYCSPKRNGEHTLKLTIQKSNNKRASITYCFNASGFSDNCNLFD